MSREEAIKILKEIEIPVNGDNEEERNMAFSMAIEALEQETVPKESYDHEYFLRKEFEMKIARLEQQIARQEPQEPILEKIRDQLKSNLRGVEITLEVLVENDPLRPTMEGAKTTLEDCLELIEQAEAESI